MAYDTAWNKNKQNLRVHVGNVSFQSTKESLCDYFGDFGNLTDVYIGKDHVSQKSKGYAFLTFESEKDVKNVFSMGETHFVDGRKVRISRAFPKKPRGPVYHMERMSTKGGYNENGKVKPVAVYAAAVPNGTLSTHSGVVCRYGVEMQHTDKTTVDVEESQCEPHSETDPKAVDSQYESRTETPVNFENAQACPKPNAPRMVEPRFFVRFMDDPTNEEQCRIEEILQNGHTDSLKGGALMTFGSKSGPAQQSVLTAKKALKQGLPLSTPVQNGFCTEPATVSEAKKVSKEDPRPAPVENGMDSIKASGQDLKASSSRHGVSPATKVGDVTAAPANGPMQAVNAWSKGSASSLFKEKKDQGAQSKLRVVAREFRPGMPVHVTEGNQQKCQIVECSECTAICKEWAEHIPTQLRPFSPKGMQNNSNCCYLIVVLQNLFSSKGMRKCLSKISDIHRKHSHLDRVAPLSVALEAIYMRYVHTSTKPEDFKEDYRNLLNALNDKRFTETTQCDPVEFFDQLVAKLTDEFQFLRNGKEMSVEPNMKEKKEEDGGNNKEKKEEDGGGWTKVGRGRAGRQPECLLEKNFGLQLEIREWTEMDTNGVVKTINKNEPVENNCNHLLIKCDGDSVTSVQSGLRTNFSGERFCLVDETQHETAGMKFRRSSQRLNRIPEVLVINPAICKLNQIKQIAVDMDVTIPDFAVRRELKSVCKNYTLKSGLFHIGHQSHKGHYISFCLEECRDKITIMDDYKVYRGVPLLTKDKMLDYLNILKFEFDTKSLVPQALFYERVTSS